LADSAVGFAVIDCVDGFGSDSESDFGFGSGSDSNRHHSGFAVLSDLVKVYSTRQPFQPRRGDDVQHRPKPSDAPI